MNQIHNYIDGLQDTLEQLDLDAIQRAIDILHEARQRRSTVFVMGNGGSATTASHVVCDLAKNTRAPGAPDFRVIGLSDNMALLSAYANDEGYENVFAQQLIAFVQPQDVVIAISTSGASRNVLEAVEVANRSGAITIGMTGFDGGRLSSLVALNLHVPSNIIEHVEDIHLMLEHLICQNLRQQALHTPLAELPFAETTVAMAD